MTGIRTVRPAVLAAVTALLTVGSASPASAECAAPTYHGGAPLRIGECPEAVAGGASAVVWAVLLLAAGLWAARALSRPGPGDDADLRLIDRVFEGDAGDDTKDVR